MVSGVGLSDEVMVDVVVVTVVARVLAISSVASVASLLHKTKFV